MTGITRGSNPLMGVYKGSTRAEKVYVGNTLIWPYMKRIYFDFTGVPNGPLPVGWVTRSIGGSASPEIFSNYIRMGPSTPNNSNSQGFAGYTGDSVSTDNQIIRGTTRSALNGLIGCICLKMDATMMNGVIAILTTGSDRGIWTVNNGVSTKRSGLSSSHAVGDTWALKAEGNVYTLIRNPNFDNTGGTSVGSWTDTGNIVNHGPNYRYGAFYVNSDRNIFGVQNWGPGFDDFDFRDLAWTA